MLKTRLELLGDFHVFAADDSEKGRNLAATEHPDVILMDLEMPDEDSWEVVASPKEGCPNRPHPDHRHVRICASERARKSRCHGLR
jgi:CheY-like chemotaxis protein